MCKKRGGCRCCVFPANTDEFSIQQRVRICWFSLIGRKFPATLNMSIGSRQSAFQLREITGRKVRGIFNGIKLKCHRQMKTNAGKLKKLQFRLMIRTCKSRIIFLRSKPSEEKCQLGAWGQTMLIWEALPPPHQQRGSLPQSSYQHRQIQPASPRRSAISDQTSLQLQECS